MPTVLGSLRRLALTPSPASVGFSQRRFPGASSPAAGHLEAIPRAVVCGFEWAIDARDLWEIERRLELADPPLRGFAYEGATMALTVRDAMGPGRGNRTRELLSGRGGLRHIFLNYIGVGFAMARLPRMLWGKVLPAVSGSPYHPVMSWLAVDGYGFDRAYFDTRRWVDRQYRPAPHPWQGSPEYFRRAADQGVGRALWFIHGARPDHVAAAVGRFAGDRHGDLWSGVGLAAVFAGGASPADLAALRRAAGAYAGELAQGAVFAAKARDHSGTVPAHTHAAVTALAGVGVEKASALADECAVPPSESGRVPAYETWRRNVRIRLQ
ncbi:DUF1702 family protein [Streptomyces triculaminicus]|uniref:DUF1702 family protein n=1 Tax=Streptomyces triculaminicus TaxID=2816232 RepID=UPI0037B3AFB7